MTEHRRPGAGHETWVEARIREAAERGLFDDLPGAGKPIPDRGEDRDELWWVKQKLREENLTLPLPASLALRKKAEQARAAAAEAGSEAEARRIIAEINELIVEGNRKAMSGPPLNLMPFDVEEVARDWRDRHPAPPEPAGPAPGGPAPRPPLRRRFGLGWRRRER